MGKSPSDLEEIFSEYPLARYGKGQVILRPDEKIEKIIYITDGMVGQYDITPAGDEVILNVFKPGAFFPVSNILNNVTNRYFFEALSPVAARLVPSEHVITLLNENPKITLDLLSRVYNGTDGIIRRMAHLMGGTAKSRLIFELLNASYRFGEKGDNKSIYIALSENDLAKRSGLTRETVNRVIRQLKKDALVSVKRGVIEIPSIKKLEEQIGVNL